MSFNPGPDVKKLADAIARNVLRLGPDRGLWLIGYLIGVLHCRLGSKRVWSFLDDLRAGLDNKLPSEEGGRPFPPDDESTTIH